jgi:DNA-binding GntR family transcriptional regulator
MSSLLARWACGEATDEDLQVAEQRLLGGEQAVAAPPGARAA